MRENFLDLLDSGATRTTLGRIKHRYNSLSSTLHKIVNAELDDMLAKDII